METQQPSSQNFLKELESFFNTYCHVKAPFHLPPKAKEFIVTYGPWITLILIILSLPILLAALSLSLFFSFAGPAVNPLHGGPLPFVHWLTVVASLILEAFAIPGLFKRSLKSWYLIYYAALLGALGSLLSFDIIGLVLGTAISMFFLFEIKEYYK